MHDSSAAATLEAPPAPASGAPTGSAPKKRTLFGTDGIRGVANEPPLTPQLALAAGRAIGERIITDGIFDSKPVGDVKPRFVIGKDTRASGDLLESALAAGLAAEGVDVLLAGVLPTPAVAHLVKAHGASGGGMISASHNPFADNGLKFFNHKGLKFDDKSEGIIEADILAELRGEAALTGAKGARIGRITHLERATRTYLEFVRATLPHDFSLEGWTIALDCANGSASTTTPHALRELGAEVHVFHAEPDGVNINEGCGSTHPETISALVLQTGAMLGLAHDGDADRLLLCDETGSPLDGDELLCIAALAHLEAGTLEKNTLVATIMSNYAMEATLAAKGGKVVRTNVGDRYVLEAMLEHGYNLGGEQSGHMIFADHLCTGDGLISALQIIRVLVESGKKLSELRQCLQKYPQAQRNMRVSRKPPIDTLARLQETIAQVEAELNGQGRVLIRYSGTEPKIRLLVEGPDAARLDGHLDTLAAVVEAELC